MAAVATHLIVFVCGGAVLAIEMLGTRLLGPYYGVDLYLWSALITVTLLALSGGYALGGRLADRGPRLPVLAALPAAAGVWMTLVPGLRRPLVLALEPLGLQAGLLLSALLLFGPPLLVLGMVSPYAVRLRARRLEEVGRTAGDLYALSTVAGVLAALATGFWLIPSVGVTRLAQGTGAALLGVAALGFGAGRSAAAAALALLLGAAAAGVPGERAHRAEGLLALRQSPYGEIRVLDREGARYLLLDGGVHTVVWPAPWWQSHYPYVATLRLAERYFPQPGAMLLVGMGGGSVAREYAAAGWEVDVVEVDPAVERVARELFGFDGVECRVHRMDGRRYLAAAGRSYDLVVLDAYGSSYVPFHLVTREAFGLAAARLRPQGLVALHLEAPGDDHLLLRSVCATLATCFPETLVLPSSRPAEGLTNYVVLASRRSLEADPPPPPGPGTEAYQVWASERRAEAWSRRFRPDLEGAPVLTDDLNPVDLWAGPVNLAERRALHDFFGPGAGDW